MRLAPVDFEGEGGPSEASNVSDADAPQSMVSSTLFASSFPFE